MKWINIIDQFPEDGAIVYAKMNGKPEILCNYKNDSFGLGDYDFRVVKWRYAIQPTVSDPKFLNYNLRSTLLAEGRINDDFSGLRQRLA